MTFTLSRWAPWSSCWAPPLRIGRGGLLCNHIHRAFRKPGAGVAAAAAINSNSRTSGELGRRARARGGPPPTTIASTQDAERSSRARIELHPAHQEADAASDLVVAELGAVARQIDRRNAAPNSTESTDMVVAQTSQTSSSDPLRPGTRCMRQRTGVWGRQPNGRDEADAHRHPAGTGDDVGHEAQIDLWWRTCTSTPSPMVEVMVM